MTIFKADKEFIIACGNNTALKLLEVQLEGSKKMSAEAMLQGKKIETKTLI